MNKKVIIKGKKVIGGVAEGEALVSKVLTMGATNVDSRLGIITERNHPLQGISLKGKVFVFPIPRGSGGWYGFGGTTQYRVNPTAMVYWKGNALTIRGAIELGRPTVGECEEDPSKIIDTGDWVKVDGDRGIVEVTKKE